jgi:hypothetical protein
MKNKLGSNEPCRCGSNKKYKKCCMNDDFSSSSGEVLDFLWIKLRKIEGEAIDKYLIPYFKNELPEEVMELALEDFCFGGLPKFLDEELILNNFFIPWLLFNWIAEDDLDIKQFDSLKTISQNYISTYEKKLNSEVKGFIEAMNQTYYSFYSIQEVVLEKSLIVKDILLGTEHIIKEKMATHSLKRGNIIFGRIVTIENQSIFVGMAPYIIPVTYHNNILDYKKWLIEENEGQALTPEVMREYSAYDLVDYFFEIMQECYSKPLPTLFNTDGEPIIFSKSYFKLSLTPREIFQKLLPLTLSKDPNEFLTDAEYNSSGDIIKINFPWLKKGNKQNKHWDNTVMGDILIEGNRLILETNSEMRIEKGKKLLSKYLDNHIKFEKTLLKTPEQELESSSNIDIQNKEEIETSVLP